MKINDLLLSVWVVLLVLFRPSIFGENYNALVFAFFALITIVIVFISRASILIMNRRRLLAVASIYVCVIYFFIQGIFLSNAIQTVLNSCILLFLAVPCITLILEIYQEKVLRYFVNVHYWLSVSAVITLTIFILIGLSVDKIPVLANLESITGYRAEGRGLLSTHILFFPATVAWSSTGFFGINIPRFVGIYREPGMAQIFFLTAFALTYFVPVANIKIKRFFLIVGSVLLFSAAGMVNLVLLMIVFYATNTSIRKNLSGIVRKPFYILLILVFFAFLVKSAIVMVEDRFNTNSGSSRLESFENGIDRFSKNIFFGEGYYNSFEMNSEGEVISDGFIGIIGVSYQIGFIGLILYAWCWSYSLVAMTNKRALCIYIPCLVTLLFSQPSYNDIFTWFLLLIDTRNFTLSTIK